MQQAVSCREGVRRSVHTPHAGCAAACPSLWATRLRRLPLARTFSQSYAESTARSFASPPKSGASLNRSEFPTSSTSPEAFVDSTMSSRIGCACAPSRTTCCGCAGEATRAETVSLLAGKHAGVRLTSL